MSDSDDLYRYARAVPLAAITAVGLGPLDRASASENGHERLRSIRASTNGLLMALSTAGAVGQHLLGIVAANNGSMSPKALAKAAAAPSPEIHEAAVQRLIDARLLISDNSSYQLPDKIRHKWHTTRVSMSDPQAITGDSLGIICDVMGLPSTGPKQELVDTIASVYADKRQRKIVREHLSDDAWDLLNRVADLVGRGVADAYQLGLSAIRLGEAAPVRFSRQTANADAEVRVLRELTFRGILGVANYRGEIWIWDEAWSILDRSSYPIWPVVDEPSLAPRLEEAHRLPPLMMAADRALQHWEKDPPKVLKNAEARLGRVEIKSTAKALDSTDEIVELIGRLMLHMELLLPNTISSTGRGRTYRVDQVWRTDPEIAEAWNSLSLQQRWLRLVAEWTNPSNITDLEMTLINRHLLLWEFASQAPDEGWVDRKAAAVWLAHRYAPHGDAELFAEAIDELVTLGIVTSSAPHGLTTLGRLALDDPDGVAAAVLGDANHAIIQPDLTIIAPPDLDPELAAQLSHFAELESDAGAHIYRLSETLLTRAVQHGETIESIHAFLDTLSSVPVAPTVYQLVRDAASRAGKVKIMSASTIVVAADPVDLMIACNIKVLNLTAIAPTVAVTSETAAKVRSALDKKGLSPEVVALNEPSEAVTGSDLQRVGQRSRRTPPPNDRLAVNRALALTSNLVEDLLQEPNS